VLGIIIGDIQSAHTWVFALTAGMFLYISLVDMVSNTAQLEFWKGLEWEKLIAGNRGNVSPPGGGTQFLLWPI